jgi:hypothetical protein
MSNYKSSFLEPEIKQYGSHMVMTNVSRHSKRKFINIDSKYRDEYGAKYLDSYSQYGTNYSANFNVTLPERITEVKSIIVCNAEIPMSFYNISGTLGNNCFKLITGTSVSGTTWEIVKIPNGEYTRASLVTAITTAIHATSNYTGSPDKITLAIDSTTQITTITSTTGSYTIQFDIDSDGNSDAYHVKDKLGWLLGFRKQHYTVQSTGTAYVSSENILDLNSIKYLYLVLDEYTKGNQNSFISPMHDSLIRKNILAKITLNRKTFPYGEILPANNFNGYLLTDRRNYTGKVDLQKLNVQLVDDTGTPVDLNGLDFSFCLEVEHE